MNTTDALNNDAFDPAFDRIDAVIDPTTKEEAASLLALFNKTQTAREALIATRDEEIETIRASYAQHLAVCDNNEEIITAGLQGFAESNPLLFDEVSTVSLGDHGRIGYQKGKWSVVLESNVTDEDVIADLQALIEKGKKSRATARDAALAAVARMLLRSKLEFDRKQAIAQSDNADVLEVLGAVGASVQQETKFVVKPNRKGQAKPGTTAAA